MSEIHACSNEIVKNIDVPENPANSYSDNILKLSKYDYVCKDIREFSKNIVSEFSQWCLTRKNIDHFVYNDLHFANLLMDENGEIAILDFGFCAIGDVHREFHQMHKCDLEWSNHFSNMYEEMTGTVIDERGVELTSKIDQVNYHLHLLNLQQNQNGDGFDYLPNVKAPIVRWMSE